MEGDQISLQDIFTFEKTGIAAGQRVKGRFRSTGVHPRFTERLLASGIELPAKMFQTVVEIG
jgi:pilus assembly protein CpaF